jgi:hypothetical protein
MKKTKENGRQRGANESTPRRVFLPGFITDDEIGLGDAISRVTSYFRVKPCGGCRRRAAAFSRWIVFTRHRVFYKFRRV